MNKIFRLLFAFVLLSSITFTLPAKPVYASTTFIVNSISDIVDANPGNGVCATSTNVCTLRAAVMEANALPDADVIVLEPRKYTLTIDGNSSADNDDNSFSGDLDVTEALTIQVNGAGMATIQGRAWTERIIENISPSSGLILNNIIIKLGNTSESGGGLLNNAPAELNNVIIENNISVGNGGGIANFSQLTVTNSTIRNNVASDGGGGIYNSGQIVLTVTDTTVNNNNSASNGGGIFVEHNLNSSDPSIITGSTINNNSSDKDGGGMFVTNGTVELVNSTISTNFAKDDGGGLFGNVQHSSVPRFKLASVTITQNTADSDASGNGNGGGVAANNSNTSAYLFMNTIIANNFDSSPNVNAKILDCSAKLNSAAYNLLQNITGCTITGDTTGNIIGMFDGLGPLQNYGGPTSVHLPSYGIGLDDGNPNGCTDFQGNLLTVDQQGQPRHQGEAGIVGRCDIGSVELEQPT